LTYLHSVCPEFFIDSWDLRLIVTEFVLRTFPKFGSTRFNFQKFCVNDLIIIYVTHCISLIFQSKTFFLSILSIFLPNIFPIILSFLFTKLLYLISRSGMVGWVPVPAVYE